MSATPQADKYDDRFQPYTPPANSETAFKFTQLRTNAVVRWEYRPGSTLFLVWAHGRQDSRIEQQPHGAVVVARLPGPVLALHPDNTFLIKVAYWLNR